MIYIWQFMFIMPMMMSVALITLAESKMMGSMQSSVGPNIMGFYGLLQPMMDGMKLVLKENIIPIKSNNFYYLFAPMFTFFISLIIFIVIPFNFNFVIIDINNSILFIFALSTLSIYGVLYGGWSSHSKYSFMGSLSGTSQLMSYEISLGLIMISILILNNSINIIDYFFSQIIIWNIFPLFPIFIIFFISLLAESNRTPFDLLEAESELVAGFLVEYSSMMFALYYLGEYTMLLLWSLIISLLFFPFYFNLFFIFNIFSFIWMSASLPRLSYDQLMNLGWSYMLPMTMTYFIIMMSMMFIFW